MDEIPTISVSITEYSHLQEGWMKVLKYQMKVIDASGERIILRSSKDFKILRKILVTRWPGCIIPALPEEYSKKNPNTSLIPDCLIIHNLFITKIMALDYFSNSDIVQLFISGPTEFAKLSNTYKIPNYSTISESFENNFKDCLDYQTNPENIMKLVETKEKFKGALKSVKVFHEGLLSNWGFCQKYNKGIENLQVSVKEALDWLGAGETGEVRSAEVVNPVERISGWLLGQIQDLSGIIQAIEKVEELVKVKEISGLNINSTTLEIQKLAVGRKSIAAIFNNKSKDEWIKAKQNMIDDLNAQVKALDIIIPVVSSKLLNDDIPKFQTRNAIGFNKEIKSYTEAIGKELNAMKKRIVMRNNK